MIKTKKLEKEVKNKNIELNFINFYSFFNNYFFTIFKFLINKVKYLINILKMEFFLNINYST